MSGEQMDMVQDWIGDAVARNLKPLCHAAYVGIGLLVVGTAALKTEVRPVLTNHETRLVVLEWAGGVSVPGASHPPTKPPSTPK